MRVISEFDDVRSVPASSSAVQFTCPAAAAAAAASISSGV